jgi:multidrug efflux pump subunit AcrA (membrane-fusion protein)
MITRWFLNPPLALAAAFALSAAACGGSGAPSTLRNTPPPQEVRVATASVRSLAQTFEAGGIIQARMTAQITPRIAAELREITVQPGARVRRGQVVAVLDDRDLSAHLAAAHASFAAAQSGAAAAGAERESANARLTLSRDQYRRIEQLRERNSATPQELDRATADLRIAEAGLRAAGAKAAEAAASVDAAEAASRAAGVAASFSTIAAPFDGLITNTLLEPGNMASPGVPLLTIETDGPPRLEVQIDAARARFIEVGDTAAVEIDGPGEAGTLTGRVVEVGRAVDPMSHAFLVKVELPPAAAARSGTFARARFTLDDRRALAVPASTIVRRGQLSMVFVVDDANRARMRAITEGERNGDWVEALAGVQEGEAVIVSPPASLLDGAEVRTAGARP